MTHDSHDSSYAIMDTTLGSVANERGFNQDVRDIVKRGAYDNEFFCQTFFPQTARDPFPPFHFDTWNILDAPEARYCNIQIFRGGAKTSILRMYMGKRIAYGQARTILFLGKSESKAEQSVMWIKRRIDNQKALYPMVFGLKRGAKWGQTEIEIVNETLGFSIWVMAIGITGSFRGINFDDYRPDLIVADDVLDDENAATLEQREKMADLLLGAVKHSLAPPIDAPLAKMVMLQTPLDFGDISVEAQKDEEFVNAKFGCWSKETEGLAIDNQESAWPIRYPTETLRAEKRAAIARNRYSIFAREKECKLITPETADFRQEWITYFDLEDWEKQNPCVMAIDPVPPPTEKALRKGLHDRDYEAFSIVGYKTGGYYLLDYRLNRGHQPNWTINTFFELMIKWRPLKLVVETTAYQATLAWLLRQAMRTRGLYVPIEELDDKTSKRNRIIGALQGVASERQLYVCKHHTEFVSQFCSYPNVDHDDLIECVANAVTQMSKYRLVRFAKDESDYEDLPRRRGAP